MTLPVMIMKPAPGAGLCGGSLRSLLPLKLPARGLDLAPCSHVNLILHAQGEAVVAPCHLRVAVVPVPATTFDVRPMTISPRGRAGDLFTLYYHSTTLRLLQPART